MKKLSFICSLLLILGLLATPAFSTTAIKFDFDNDPNTWETEAWLTEPGDTLNVDVYLTGYIDGDNLCYVDHELTYDETKLSPGDCIIEPPWDTSFMFCGCGDGECWAEPYHWGAGVPPAPKIKLVRWVFNAIGGDSEIQSHDGGWCDVDYDCAPIEVEELATIHGPCGVSVTPFSQSLNSGETIEFSASQHGDCTNPSDYSWEVISERGSVIDPDTGLYTAGCLVGSTSSEDTIKATDTANNGIGYATVTLNGCRITSISGGTIVLSPGESMSLSAYKSYCPDSFLLWAIDPPSAIGSTIITNPDGTALYIAGYNTASVNVTETIKVIDINSCCYEGGSVECTAKTKQVQVEPCIVDLDPKDNTRGSGGTIQFSSISDCCPDPIYDWAITVSAGIGSSISATGFYRAGRDFPSCDPVTETIEVTEVCSGKTATTNVSVDACKVTISPPSAAVDPLATIQFTTGTPLCCFNPPSYSWSLSSGGSTSGGTIDNNGLYTAGPNDGIDIVKVTDTANYKAAHTATVTVGTPTTTTTTVSPTTTTTIEGACVVIIDPKSETVEPLATIQFTAMSEFCDNPPSYSWSLSSGGSTSGGTIDSNGLYTAGPNEGTDIVTVTDNANNDLEDTATVTVGIPTTTTSIEGPTTTTTIGPTTTVVPIATTTVGPTTTTAASTTTVVSTTTTTTPTKSIEVSPPEVMRSRWIPLFRLMSIKGTGTNFAIFKTPVEYDSKSVLKLPALILSPEAIWQVILVMPSLLTGIGFDGESETVTVTVDGVSETFEIKMLPAPFDEKKNLK